MSGRYIDISSWQPENINWANYIQWSKAGDGISRVCLRVDQGIDTPDTLFTAHYDKAKAAGVEVFIFYHMAYPWLHTGWQGASDEVASFKQILAGRLGPNDFLMLDAESVDGHTGPGSWYYDWLADAAQAFNVPNGRVSIYANGSYIASNLQDARLAAFPLILAAWTGGTTTPPAPHPWNQLFAWQYTDKAVVSGIPEPVDANFFIHAPVVPPPTSPPTLNLELIRGDMKAIIASAQDILNMIGN